MHTITSQKLPHSSSTWSRCTSSAGSQWTYSKTVHARRQCSHKSRAERFHIPSSSRSWYIVIILTTIQHWRLERLIGASSSNTAAKQKPKNAGSSGKSMAGTVSVSTWMNPNFKPMYLRLRNQWRNEVMVRGISCDQRAVGGFLVRFQGLHLQCALLPMVTSFT